MLNGKLIVKSSGRRRRHFQIAGPQMPLEQLNPQFHLESPWVGGMKNHYNGHGLVNKMVTIPYMVKTFLKYSL